MQQFYSLAVICTMIANIGSGQAADVPRPADVIVLSTLHQLHGQTNGYSFEVLAKVIEDLDPDILAIELTSADLKSRREQSTKLEYQRSVFPLLDKHNYEVVALEPTQPLYDELVGMLRQANRELAERDPKGAEFFDVYVSTLFDYLDEQWDSPKSVNSAASDMLFESKHRFQSKIFGPLEAAAWEKWNQHFLQQIEQSAAANPGKRILVLVGAEHAYWLRKHLGESRVTLANTERLLEELGY
jgi:hypothetical protein